MKYWIIIQFFLLSIIPIFSIDIKLYRELGNIKYSDYSKELSEKFKQRNIGYTNISWIGKYSILYAGNPLFWLIDIEVGQFNRLRSLENIVNDDTLSMLSCNNSDDVVISIGRIFETKYGIYSMEYGWKYLKSSEEYHKLRINPVASSIYWGHSWEYKLLGNHTIVPGPVVSFPDTVCHEDYEIGVSLKLFGSDELQPLPVEFHSLRNMGSYGMTAVSFDRFRIAIYSDVVLKVDEPYDRFNTDSGLYILKVEYNGKVATDTILRKEPSNSSVRSGQLSKGTDVLVIDTENYEIDENQREDFWYFVKSDNVSGWIYGGDLIIEDQTWEERLALRGKPLNWDSIEDYDRTNEIIIGHVFDGDFQVELKDDADKDADIIRIVKPEEQFIILGQSEKSQLINNNYNRWYHVRFDNGIEGWIFGYYISFEKLVENSMIEEESEVDKENFTDEVKAEDSINNNSSGEDSQSFSKVIIIVTISVLLFIIIGIVLIKKKKT